MTNGYNFNTVEKISDAQFECMKISDGIAIQLKSMWKKYEKKTHNLS